MARVHVASVRRAVIDPVPPPLFKALGEAMDVIRTHAGPRRRRGRPPGRGPRGRGARGRRAGSQRRQRPGQRSPVLGPDLPRPARWHSGAAGTLGAMTAYPYRRPGLAGPPRARPRGDARGGELAGARLPRRRGDAAVHGVRRRSLPHRRRRPRVRRPGLLVGPDDPRPRPPAGAARGPGRRRPGASRSGRPARTRSPSPRRSSAASSRSSRSGWSPAAPRRR